MTATAVQVVSRAASQVGYKEGHNNDTKYGRWIGLNHAPWCMQIVSWDFAKESALALIGGKSSSTIATSNWFKRQQGQWGHTPQVGALVFYDFGHLGHVHHVEIVERVLSGGRIQTIGGNTSSGHGGSQSNGNGCYRRIRSATASVVGYGYPRYAKKKKPAKPVVSKPTKSPAHNGDGGPTGKFPLPGSYWYGPFASKSHNRSGYYKADRKPIEAIQREVGVKATGHYTPGTYAAVKKWQRKYGLGADGLVGPKTWASMGKH